jgi:hypothetical protein
LLEKMRRRLIGTMGAGTIVSPAASGPAPKPEVAS